MTQYIQTDIIIGIGICLVVTGIYLYAGIKDYLKEKKEQEEKDNED